MAEAVEGEAALKVLFSHDIFVAQARGGASRIFAGLHDALRGQGVQSRIAAGLHMNTYLTGRRGVAGVRLPGAASSLALRRATRPVNVALDQAALKVWRPSVYHLTYFPRRTGPVAAPVAVTVLDMIHELYPAAFPREPTSARKRHWTRAADLVFAISDRTKQDLVELFSVPEERVVVVHPGVSTPAPDPKVDLRGYGDYLLYVGERAWSYKNFEPFLAAMARSEVARDLHLVCFGGRAVTPRERMLLDDLGLAPRAHFLDGGDGMLGALYAGARALVYPSTYEGFGLPPVEAMSLGCPVVCSRGGSIPEVVGDAALLFDAGDIDDMAAALDRVVVDDELRTGLVRAGAGRAGDFTWERAAQATVAAYRQVSNAGSQIDGAVP